MIEIGQSAPDFQLSDLSGAIHSLSAWHGKIVVLNFWSAECIWCERVDREMLIHFDHWGDQVKVFWIASNENEPGELIKQVADSRHLPVVLLDHHQQVANLYGALVTPHFFIIDSNGKLCYMGAWDDITFRQRVATQWYVPEAIDALLRGSTLTTTQTPAYGCVLVRSE